MEARIVNLTPDPANAELRGDITEAREADLIGRPGPALSVQDGGVQFELGPAEIRTIQLRRPEPMSATVDVLDTFGTRVAM